MQADVDFVVAIPARFAATRLPGKPLRQLGGEPLVLHVARRALAAGAREAWVAADDPRIADADRIAIRHPRRPGQVGGDGRSDQQRQERNCSEITRCSRSTWRTSPLESTERISTC